MENFLIWRGEGLKKVGIGSRLITQGLRACFAEFSGCFEGLVGGHLQRCLGYPEPFALNPEP